MPTPLDIAFVILFAVFIAAFEPLVFDRGFKAQIAAGKPNARKHAYRRTIVGQSALAAIAIVLWARAARPWQQLGFVIPNGWRLLVSISVVLAMTAFAAHQIRAIRRLSAEKRVAINAQVHEVAFLLPHSSAERRWFWLLSLTAGVCEEVLYRGFLTWVASAYLGAPAGIAIAVAAFGVAHAYQGGRGILKTGAVGLVMSLIVVATGWLIPAMVVHAL